MDVFTGKDLIEIDGNVVNDLANGKVVEVRFPNNIANMETGKDGNAIVTYISNGELCEVTLRLLLGSKTDQYLLSKIESFKGDPVSFVALNGKFVKKVGDGTGNLKKITYDLQKGVILKNTESEEDVTGDMEQGVAVYLIRFKKGLKTIS